MIALPAPLTRPWTDRFVLDIAMSLEGTGDSAEVVLEAHNYTADQLIEFSKDPLFTQRVEHFRTQLREHGFTFKLKAKAQAELLLDTSWGLIHNPDTSPAVKADMIKWTAKMAGYEPTTKDSATEGGVKINIYMGDPSQAPPSGMRVIEQE
jgi:hypothetical protein